MDRRRRLVAPDRLHPDFGITLGDRQRKDLEAEGKFPKRVPVTERTHAYVEDELFDLISARIAQRDGKAA
jgi:hypothetical protein